MKAASKTSTSLRFSSLGVIGSLTLAMLVVAGFAYAAVQQGNRQNANDPQIQYASDIAAKMSAGDLAEDAVDTHGAKVDPSVSLATFMTIIDGNDKVLASNMEMNGQVAIPPKGVLAASSVAHQNRITWQPQSGTRIGLVVQAYMHDNNTGYVLVGRSLKEIDIRQDMLFWMAAVTAGAVVLLGVGAAMMSRKG